MVVLASSRFESLTLIMWESRARLGGLSCGHRWQDDQVVGIQEKCNRFSSWLGKPPVLSQLVICSRDVRVFLLRCTCIVKAPVFGNILDLDSLNEGPRC